MEEKERMITKEEYKKFLRFKKIMEADFERKKEADKQSKQTNTINKQKI